MLRASSMGEQMPLATVEGLEILEAGDDFIDMIDISQCEDSYSLSLHDIGAGVGVSAYSQSSSQPYETNFELNHFNDYDLSMSDNSASFLDTYTGLSIAGLVDDGLSMFYNTTFQNYDGARNEALAYHQTNSLPVAAKNLEISAVNPPEKQKFEDGLSHFIGMKNSGPERKQRKRFAPDRRKEVDQVRKVGACIRCRITKTRVRVVPSQYKYHFAEFGLFTVQARFTMHFLSSRWEVSEPR